MAAPEQEPQVDLETIARQEDNGGIEEEYPDPLKANISPLKIEIDWSTFHPHNYLDVDSQ